MTPEHGTEYNVLAPAQSLHRLQISLNHAETFAIVDRVGNVPLMSQEAGGLFHRGTRFLNRFELRLNRTSPVVLGSTPSAEGSEVVTYLTNASQRSNGVLTLEQDTFSVRRSQTVYEATLYERLQIHNYSLERLPIEIELLFGADFADIFEVRGTKRGRRGKRGTPHTTGQTVHLPYQGLDGLQRTTIMRFVSAPDDLSTTHARFRLELDPGAEATLETQVECRVGEVSTSSHSSAPSYAPALRAVQSERSRWNAQFATLSSDNERFNDWLNRSLYDLALLHTQSDYGEYVYAGIPWFATIFGRDGLITALETLAFAPDLAAGVLRTLATLQGREHNREREEEPGKIPHELRHGEMAQTREIPFGRYYGSVDATPLFLLVLAEYAERTGDLVLVQELWPAVEAAMDWLETSCDAHGTGYLAYRRRATAGLMNQGWKDSHDSIFHANGALAAPPIALSEVQAYVYAARRRLAQLATRIGREEDATTWEAKARVLRERFNREFWLRHEQVFALALDGQGQPCQVVSSNAGQCLFGGIADPERAAPMITRLMQGDMFCGWGIRTLSAQARRYNPMSYHNGSVWPHDNALIAAGLARYGATTQASHLLTALFDASLVIADHRLPELFCGFSRSLHPSPVPYPVACKPQAWAAGSVFLLLQAALGLEINSWEQRVSFNRTALPPWLNRLTIRGLRVGEGQVDVSVIRDRWGAAVEVIDKQGDVEIVVRK